MALYLFEIRLVCVNIRDNYVDLIKRYRSLSKTSL